jgi:abelson tyrosine-protein kinase 1
MAGQIQLTNEVDIYAFAICCVEILTMGGLPWPRVDDQAVRRFVLRESSLNLALLLLLSHRMACEEDNTRPPFLRTRVVTNGLLELLTACWHRDPFRRPQFSQIVRDIRGLRRSVGTEAPIELDDSSKPSPRTGKWGSEVVVAESPDMRPEPLPIIPPTSRKTFSNAKDVFPF